MNRISLKSATPLFGPAIDEYAGYDPPEFCDPTAQPGVVDFKDLLVDTYGAHTWRITRDCDEGGASEHKEGRALDFGFDYTDIRDRADATDLLNSLLATDQYGNRHALARRLGIMCIIWNRRIWKSYQASAGWQSYSCDGTPGDCHTDHIHVSFSWAGARRQTSWWAEASPRGLANVYGILTDGRLTFTRINAATGRRTHGAVVSSTALGFFPKSMATLNFNTLLVTSTTGQLYRIDVTTNHTSLAYRPPVLLGVGWTHDLLTYDGNGHLFGVAAGTLRRYTLTAAKPAPNNITTNTVIGSGFTLKTLTATGPDWLLGTTSDGLLLSYRVRGADNWSRYELKPATWPVFTHLLSAGGGVYFGRRIEGSVFRYLDDDPYSDDGGDPRGLGVVDTGGWSQILLSAQPGTVS